jgi:hypothetical protein
MAVLAVLQSSLRGDKVSMLGRHQHGVDRVNHAVA